MAETNLSVDVYTRLSERILKWEYPPGHRLTEEELCAEFSVSRSPIREALGMLTEQGLVDKKVRTGYSVRRLDLEEVKELYDLRIILELAVVDMICEHNIDTVVLDDLEKRWKILLDSLPDLASSSATEDELFHARLAGLCGNRSLEKMLKDIDKRIHFVRLSDITNPERLKDTCEDHLEIIQSLRSLNKEEARKAIKRNIEWGKTNVEAAIKDALIRAHLST
ncbi:GntR family transcriptional regulator [Treponema sp.]